VLRLYKVLGFIYVLHLPEICCIYKKTDLIVNKIDLIKRIHLWGQSKIQNVYVP
jgi:hypothetical protein